MLQRLWSAFQQDRWLQISVAAFVILYIGFQERLAAKEKMYLAAAQMPLEDSDRSIAVPDDGALIIELPAGPEAATQIKIAQLSGRRVHVKEPNGDWHILPPVVGPAGRVDDHSEHVIALAKVSCAEDAPPDIKAAFNQLSLSTRIALCELAGAS